MRRCNTCISPHREEIDQMVLAGWENKEIERYLKNKYPTDALPSYDSLCNHANKHVRDDVTRASKSSKQKDKAIKKEIKESVQAVQLLRDNLSMVSQMLKQAFADGIDTAPSRRSLAELISRANDTIALILKFQDKVDRKAMSEDEIYERLMFCVADFPPEYVDMIIERWDKYNVQ